MTDAAACRAFADALALRVDDPTAGGAMLTQHLEGCSSCKACLAEHERIAWLVKSARPVIPAGLAERLARAAVDPARARVIFWRDVEGAARTALRLAAAILVVASIAVGAISTSSGKIEAEASVEQLTVDDVARLALAREGLEASLEEGR